jgi:hypothetical protein
VRECSVDLGCKLCFDSPPKTGRRFDTGQRFCDQRNKAVIVHCKHKDLGSRDEVAGQHPRTLKSLLSLLNKHRVDTGWMPQVLCCVVNATPAKPCNIANGRVIREPLTTVILQRSGYSREKCVITLPVGDIIQPRCTRSITQCICRVL